VVELLDTPPITVSFTFAHPSSDPASTKSNNVRDGSATVVGAAVVGAAVVGAAVVGAAVVGAAVVGAAVVGAAVVGAAVVVLAASSVPQAEANTTQASRTVYLMGRCWQ
jgi:hypothetical protein